MSIILPSLLILAIPSIIALLTVVIILSVKNKSNKKGVNLMNTSSKTKSNKRFLGIAFIVIAVFSFIFAVISMNSNVGSYEFSETYGGDAYTGIQNAAAQSANNIIDTNELIKTVAGGMFFISGLILVILGIYFLKEAKKENNQPSQPQNFQQEPYMHYTDNFNQGNFNQGNFNQGNYNPGNFNQGNFNQNNFNQGNFNQGNPNNFYNQH